MVIPVGERYQQTMMLMKKVNGQLETEALRPTLFVPMTGAAEKTRDVLPDPQRPEIKNGDFELPEPENGFPGSPGSQAGAGATPTGSLGSVLGLPKDIRQSLRTGIPRER